MWHFGHKCHNTEFHSGIPVERKACLWYFKELVKLGCHDSCESPNQSRMFESWRVWGPPQLHLKPKYTHEHQSALMSDSYLLERNDSLSVLGVSGNGKDGSCICISNAVAHVSIPPFIFIVGSDPTHRLPYQSQLWYIQLVALCKSETTSFL